MTKHAALAKKLRHELTPKRGYLEKIVLAVRSKLHQVTGRAAVKTPPPPMYPGAMRMGDEELDAVTAAVRDVIERKRLFRHWGPEPRLLETSRVSELEEAFARRLGTKHVLAVTSGTTALMTAMAGLGIGPGDEVVIPCYAWFTLCSAVLAVGAVPVLAEVDESLTISASDVEARLSPRTKAIIVVHMRGAPCDMDALRQLAERKGLLLIEDVAQAMGGSYHGRPLGTLGQAAAFSLQFNKILTAGEGGLVVTGDDTVAGRADVYHDVTAAARRRLDPSGWLPGLNFRMSELQGAVALAQLDRLDGLLESMRANKRRLRAAVQADLEAKGVSLRPLHDEEGDTAVALIFFVPDAERTGAIERALIREGVPALRLYRDLAQFPDDQVDLHVYTTWFPILHRSGWSERKEPWASHPREVVQGEDACPKSLDLLRRAVEVDISPDLSEEQVDQIALGIRKVVSAVL